MIYKIKRLLQRYAQEHDVDIVSWQQIAPRLIEIVTEIRDFWQTSKVCKLKLDF